MGGPLCDHSPSSLICSHYPYQHLKIKNKDGKSDGGGGTGREGKGRDREREAGGWVKEAEGKGVDVCLSVPATVICPLFGGCRGC